MPPSRMEKLLGGFLWQWGKARMLYVTIPIPLLTKLHVAFRSSQTSYIADLEFAVDIALISSKIQHLKAKTSQLANYASRAGLKLNAH